MGADLDASALPGRGDRSHRARRVEQRRLGDVVGVGERGLLARDRAHADALVDAEAAALDDAFLEAPAFAARVLEVEVGVVDAMRRDRRQRGGELALVEAERLEQQGTRDGEALDGGFAGDHGERPRQGRNCRSGVFTDLYGGL